MARECELTGKAVQFGNTVSNANNRNKTKFHPNLTFKRIFVPELDQTITVRLSQRGMRSIDKLGGLVQACRRYHKTLSPKLEKLVRRVS